MPRSYIHIQEYENEIHELRELAISPTSMDFTYLTGRI